MSVPELSPIEERIVLSVAAGETVENLAAELHVGTRTIEWHLTRARRKLERTSSLRDLVEQTTQRERDGEGGGNS